MRDFLWFGLKQAWACLFGSLMLAGILATHLWYPEQAPLARYDFLVVYALAIQVALIVFRLESVREFGVVILFHLLATAMEIFKTSTSIGSWAYPEASVLRVANVPLFTGFMYSAVGSYMARVWRVFDFRFAHFPPLWLAGLLALAAYVNFFTHHYLWDLRWLILAGVGVAYTRTTVYFTPRHRTYAMNLLLGFALVAFFLWIAENAGTFARVWVYPDQQVTWKPVGFGKFTAWFLLMQLSFVLVYALRTLEKRLHPEPPVDTVQTPV